MCGAVRFSLIASPLCVYNCHCRDCQRASNGTHTISMICDRSVVETRGETVFWDKKADSGRTVRMRACKVCGTKVWNEPLSMPDRIVMKAGTLDDLSWAQPVGNIWTSSKAPWVEIDPAGPNFEGQPQDRQALIDAWTAAHQNAG